MGAVLQAALKAASTIQSAALVNVELIFLSAPTFELLTLFREIVTRVPELLFARFTCLGEELPNTTLQNHFFFFNTRPALPSSGSASLRKTSGGGLRGTTNFAASGVFFGPGTSRTSAS